MKKFKLICMAFDGDVQRERPEFDTAEEAWEYSNDLGSKWYFYPFHFVTTGTGKTVVESPDAFLNFTHGKRVKTVQKMFKDCAAMSECKEMDTDEFMVFLGNYYN